MSPAAGGRDAAGPAARRGDRLAPFSVHELNDVIDLALTERVGPCWVLGEVSRFLAHASGHWYFTLKDDRAAASCAMFRGKNQQLRFRPQDGMAVLILATPRIYAPQGRMQLIVEFLEPAGQGAAAVALEQLKVRLAAEGLFDASRKKPLPRLPRRLGVVTSLDGAALRDVLKVLHRRFAGVSVLIAPATVQGRDAPAELIAALGALDRRQLDVLLVVRGGGAREDLAPFDDEGVVRAIAACRTPVVTGVGHEIDVTLADFAADVRAPTPSAAAEIVVKDRDELQSRVRSAGRAITGAVQRALARRRRLLLVFTGARGFREPSRRTARARLLTVELQRRLETAVTAGLRRLASRRREVARRLSPEGRLKDLAGVRRRGASVAVRIAGAAREAVARPRRRLAAVIATIQALSPLAVLARGYALASVGGPAGPIVRDAATLSPKDLLFIRLARGAVDAEVIRTLPARGPTPGDTS